MTTKHSAVLDLFRNLYRWDPVHAEYQLAQLDTETKENSILFMLLESDWLIFWDSVLRRIDNILAI